MKSLNEQENLWLDINAEELENRDEYGWCFSCFCFDFHLSCFSL